MPASDQAEVETLLGRIDDMRRTLDRMAKDRNRNAEASAVAEDMLSAEQALAQAEKLLRRIRAAISQP